MNRYEETIRALSIGFLAELFNEETQYNSGLDIDKDAMIDDLLKRDIVTAIPGDKEDNFEYTIAITERGSHYFDCLIGVTPPFLKINEQGLKERQAATELRLTAALEDFCKVQELPLLSADELDSELADRIEVLNEQRNFLSHFIIEWDENEKLV
jgi:hypothetical protein